MAFASSKVKNQFVDIPLKQLAVISAAYGACAPLQRGKIAPLKIKIDCYGLATLFNLKSEENNQGVHFTYGEASKI